MAIAGKDFVVVAADKRLSYSYSIVSRDTSKICKLTDNIILSSSGMYADFIALQRYLKARIEIYRSNIKKEPTLDNIAQLLSVTLYHKRFFPYYCFTTLCGKNKMENLYALVMMLLALMKLYQMVLKVVERN